MGIPGNAMGAAGYMPGMLCMGCIAPGIAKPGERPGMGVPPGPIIAYGIPCIICSQQCAIYNQIGTVGHNLDMAKWVYFRMQCTSRSVQCNSMTQKQMIACILL